MAGDARTIARPRLLIGVSGLRYADFGLSRGFEADLVVDDSGPVLGYEHLFEECRCPADTQQPTPFA
jgi:uncharacterized protein